jgi:hypothetical protein
VNDSRDLESNILDSSVCMFNYPVFLSTSLPKPLTLIAFTSLVNYPLTKSSSILQQTDTNSASHFFVKHVCLLSSATIIETRKSVRFW